MSLHLVDYTPVGTHRGWAIRAVGACRPVSSAGSSIRGIGFSRFLTCYFTKEMGAKHRKLGNLRNFRQN